ncbi:MAG: hypothetical protein AAGI92_04215 [Pseudomonadota bacterium]
MKIFDHPSHRPLWVRISIVVACFAWAGFEFWNGATVWAGIFATIGAVSVWGLLIAYDPDAKDS